VTWLGPALDSDQRDLAGMLDALATDRGRLRDEDVDAARDLVATLAELGIWTIGVPEAAGGGGADHVMTTVALERLGRHWPAVGWAAVQAHAAAGLLAGIPDLADELASVHSGSGAVAVVDARVEHVRLDWVEDRLRGDVARVDIASPAPALLVLTGDRSALFVRAEDLTSRPVRTTGLDGGLSCALDVDVPRDQVVVLHDVGADAALRTLLLGAAALAVGVAGAAAEGAHEYARHRHQFGGALTAIPTVRAILRSQRARVSAALAAVLAGADGPHEAHALAELACESAIEVTASALQSHGGYGYLDEYDAGTHLRDAVSLRAVAALRHGALAAALQLAGVEQEEHPLSRESA
jgi:alkylation response protein AidB-like acyl-CoA dehydrogenase